MLLQYCGPFRNKKDPLANEKFYWATQTDSFNILIMI